MQNTGLTEEGGKVALPQLKTGLTSVAKPVINIGDIEL